MNIGFYDSGLGGIKVLKDALDNGLKGNIYYVADIKNNPYGLKTSEEVKKIAIDNVGYLINLGCEVVVVACNTATSVAINDLRKIYSIPIIGIEPAIKVALDDVHKKILVLATSVTVKEKKLNDLIGKYKAKKFVELIGVDKIVKYTEDINFNNMENEIDNYIYELLKKYDLNEYSHIVLGCTHFPIIKNNFIKYINKYYKDSNIKVIDGSKGLINNLFTKIDLSNDYLKINIISTKKSNDFEKRCEEVLTDKYIKYINFKNLS